MQFRRQSRNDEPINLTPLIDVVFLLLIFFMVTTTFTKETRLGLDLPESGGEPNPQLRQSLEIIVQRDGNFLVNDQPLVNNQIDTLVKALKGVAEGNLEQPLYITADANVAHKHVVTAMDAAGRVGLVQLSITTREPKSP